MDTELEILDIELSKWTSPIISHLKNESPTSIEAESVKLKVKAARYILIEAWDKMRLNTHLGKFMKESVVNI